MKVEVVTETKVFFKLRESWNNLLSKSDSNSIFLTWEWLFYWWFHFGKNNKLFIILVRNKRSGLLLGIAPMFIKEEGILGQIMIRKMCFLGSGKVASDFLDFIIDPELREKITQVIYEYLDKINEKWDVIELEDIDCNSDTLSVLKINAKKKCNFLEKESQICPYLELPSSFELLLSSLTPNMRNNLKRRLKQAQKNNDLKLLRLSEKDNIKQAVDRLFVLHNKRFREKNIMPNQKSSFSGNGMKKFHYDIADNFLLNDWLRFYLLKFKDKVVASLYAFKFKNKLYYYQSGSDPALSNLGLGTLLFGYCMDDSIQEGLHEFDFLRGNEEYKFRWTKKSKRTFNFYIYNDTKAGTFLRYLSMIKMSAKNIIIWR